MRDSSRNITHFWAQVVVFQTNNGHFVKKFVAIVHCDGSSDHLTEVMFKIQLLRIIKTIATTKAPIKHFNEYILEVIVIGELR